MAGRKKAAADLALLVAAALIGFGGDVLAPQLVHGNAALAVSSGCLLAGLVLAAGAGVDIGRHRERSKVTAHTAGESTVRAGVGLGTLTDAGYYKEDTAGPFYPRLSGKRRRHLPWRRRAKELPITVDMAKGISAERFSDPGGDEGANWAAEEVAIVNHGTDRLRCRAFLVVKVPSEYVPVRELTRIPNDLVVVEPDGEIQVVLGFQMSQRMFSDQGKLSLGRPKYLRLVEVGQASRHCRISFGQDD